MDHIWITCPFICFVGGVYLYI